MKSVLISIRPQWCDLIASGKKTIEVRKTRPKIETPFRCYIYETKAICDTPRFMDECGHIDYHGEGAVIGEFVCDDLVQISPFLPIPLIVCRLSCLHSDEIGDYIGEKIGYGWHISDLQIYDTPRSLHDLHAPCTPSCNYSEECGGTNAEHCLFSLQRPPQSWCYVEELI